MEPPSPRRVGRLIASAARAHHERFCVEVRSRLPSEALRSMDALLETGDPEEAEGEGGVCRLGLSWIKADAGRVVLESVLEEVGKLRRVGQVGLPHDLFARAQPNLIAEYRRRAATEAPSELKAHRPEVRAALVAALLWSREREIGLRHLRNPAEQDEYGFTPSGLDEPPR